MSVAGITNAVGSIGGVASAAQSLANLFNGGGGYWSKLRKASFNGIPFAVLAESATFGRRNAIHEYPNKETMPWIEDLGLQTNVFRLQAFLVENSLVYGGGDVLAQRDRLIKTIQGGVAGSTKAPGLGSLIHPTYGAMKVNCLQAEIGASWDRGRVVELRLVFARGGDRLYPQAKKPSSNNVIGKANGLYTPTFAGFVKALAEAVVSGAQMIKTAVSTVVGWYQTVNTLIHDVKRFWNAISTLQGNFGRLFGGGNSGYAASNKNAASTATVASLINADTANRAAVIAAEAALTTAASNVASDPATFGSAVQGVVTALAASAASPADAIRLLTNLLSFSPTAIVGSSQSAVGQNAVQSACADLFRRVTVAQIAISSTQYQPTSADDASVMRDNITAVIDSEIEIAGDAGDDDTYVALKALRQAVVDDLDERGSGLSAVATFSFPATLPSLMLANRLYRDSTRADELVTQANPIHPAFMPTQFNALSS